MFEISWNSSPYKQQLLEVLTIPNPLTLTSTLTNEQPTYDAFHLTTHSAFAQTRPSVKTRHK